jgi:NADH-quinone oxidoreductase subunit J
MVNIGLALITVEVLVLASSMAVLLSKDNLYSALYLALASGFSASVLLMLNGVLPFVLIVMIYIGATITVTIILAATYRRPVTYAVFESKWISIAVVVVVLALIALKPAYSTLVYPSSISPAQLARDVLSSDMVMLLVLLVSFLSVIMAIAIRYLKVTQG